MNKERLYYTAPSDECFNELREKAIVIWQNYDDTFGYASEKINRIKNIKNLSDNFMYMVAMFDHENQFRLSEILSEKTRKEVFDRMVDGGVPDHLNPFF